MDNARHVVGCRFIQETSLQNAAGRVAGICCQAVSGAAAIGAVASDKVTRYGGSISRMTMNSVILSV